jgi:hypothetical protein
LNYKTGFYKEGNNKIGICMLSATRWASHREITSGHGHGICIVYGLLPSANRLNRSRGILPNIRLLFSTIFLYLLWYLVAKVKSSPLIFFDYVSATYRVQSWHVENAGSLKQLCIGLSLERIDGIDMSSRELAMPNVQFWR